jgi:hypothetical protein
MQERWSHRIAEEGKSLSLVGTIGVETVVRKTVLMGVTVLFFVTGENCI